MRLIAPPIQIYHPVFAKFLSRAFLPFDGDDETLRQTSKFMRNSCWCYEDHATRVRALRPSLADLLHRNMFNSFIIYIDGSKQMNPDGAIYAGCYWGITMPVCAFLEVKNEVGTGDCDPALQCQSDFVTLCSSSTVSVLLALDRQFAD